MVINILISIGTCHKLLHVILTQKVMFSNKHETFITCISNIPFSGLTISLLLV
jgi:hypothetical protein